MAKRRRKRSSSSCKTSKGKLRKGWRYGRGGRCIRAKK
jgi:hypothetical protein